MTDYEIDRAWEHFMGAMIKDVPFSSWIKEIPISSESVKAIFVSALRSDRDSYDIIRTSQPFNVDNLIDDTAEGG